MKKYKIQFLYYTDLRHEQIVEASNEVAALVIAKENARVSGCHADWVGEHEGFFLKISQP